MTNPRVKDNDKGEITVALDGRELRGWSYANDGEQRQKMVQAREYVEVGRAGHIKMRFLRWYWANWDVVDTMTYGALAFVLIVQIAIHS